jgi:methionine synthase reductase
MLFSIDLVAVPKRAAVLALSNFCTNEQEKNEMQWLTAKSPVGKKLWSNFIESQVLGIGELLAMFSSCQPTLFGLLACSSPPPPRLYSIVSSPLTTRNTISIAFSVVRYCCSALTNSLSPSSSNCNETKTGTTITPVPVTNTDNYKIKRVGLCTNYLVRKAGNWLKSEIRTRNTEPSMVRVFLKPSHSFHLPGSVAFPLILIGPGTGVSPFLGFLDHREQLEN